MSSPSHTLGATRRSTGNTTLTRCAFMRVDGCFCTLDCVLHMPSFASVYYPLSCVTVSPYTCATLFLSLRICYFTFLHCLHSRKPWIRKTSDHVPPFLVRQHYNLRQAYCENQLLNNQGPPPVLLD
jgi:hypothetical protein